MKRSTFKCPACGRLLYKTWTISGKIHLCCLREMCPSEWATYDGKTGRNEQQAFDRLVKAVEEEKESA